MFITIERRDCINLRAPASHLVEIVTPRTNDAAIAPMANLLASLALPERFALELAATAASRRFLVRAITLAARDYLEDQFAAAYPQAVVRPLTAADDPALPVAEHGDQIMACTLALRDPASLPLRPFTDMEIDDQRSAQADPLLGLLGALGRLPSGWQALCQLVIAPAPRDWHCPYQRLMSERPVAPSTGYAGNSSGSTNAQLFLLIIGAIAYLAWQAYQWFAAHNWGPLALMLAGVALGLVVAGRLVRRAARRPVTNPRLLREKLAYPARAAELRLAVITPGDVPPATAHAWLNRLVAAYGQFTHEEGNGLVPRRLRRPPGDLRVLAPLSPARRLPVLNTRELATLWHLPQAGADVALVERTTARRLLPPPGTVAYGCPVGWSTQQGRAVPVALPDDLLGRHLLLVAKTQRGKSSLLLQLAHDTMTRPPGAGLSPGLVLLDPHSDLAGAALALVPPARRDAIVYLDLGNTARPCGLNLVDAGLGWTRDQAVDSALTIFERQFDRFFGPRMEDCFRFGLMTLFEANETYCATDPHRGRERQHTILELPQLFINLAFRKTLVELARDPAIRVWWEDFFDSALDRRLRVESPNPVITKINRFVGHAAARALVGQPRSTIDPAAWVRDGNLVIINGAKGVLKAPTAALLGATLLNLVELAVGAQALLPAAARRPVRILVDEFQTMPGADYEALLSESAKFGGSLALATQSLASLDARDVTRALRATVFANLDGLFAFHCSAEDAAYLVPELGAPLTIEDLVSLGEHQCYARLSTGRERLPAFRIDLDPPPVGDPAMAASLAAAAATQYGRPAVQVAAAYAQALARIKAAQSGGAGQAQAGQPGQGVRRGPQRPQPEATAQGKSAQSRTGGARQGKLPFTIAPPHTVTPPASTGASDEQDTDDAEADPAPVA